MTKKVYPTISKHCITPGRWNHYDDDCRISQTYISWVFNTLRPRQDGRHCPDDIFKRIFMNENTWISIKISLKFVPKGPINNIPALVQIMASRQTGDKPLSEPMMVSLLTHICVTRPQWVKRPTTMRWKWVAIWIVGSYPSRFVFKR